VAFAPSPFKVPVGGKCSSSGHRRLQRFVLVKAFREAPDKGNGHELILQR
jgi:hypothetical protein